jgi:predicted dehydrogenase
MDRLRWGVLSTANIGRAAVIPAIRAARNNVLVAVASREPARAQAFAAQLDIPSWHGSYEALLEDPGIDAIYIPLPNSMHRDWTIFAAERGRHILCEKPLALSEAECREMDAAAAANGVALMEAFMYRFHPRTQIVLDLVRKGTIGEVRLLHSSFTFRLTRPDNIRLRPELGGGALMDVGCYCVNLSRTVMGSEPVEVQAFARWSTSGVDDQLVGTLRFADGALAQFDCALSVERRESYEIAGTGGSLTIPIAFLPGTLDAVIEEKHGRGEERQHLVTGDDEYRLMVEHFSDCALHGRPLRYTAGEAALGMRVIEALYRSARGDGRPIPVSPTGSPT